MAETSGRFGLPLLVTGQGQKDITLNEALQALDCLVGASVVSRQAANPPAEPVVGRCWLVAAGAGGAWAGQAGRLACWTAGGWRFQSLPTGFTLWVEDELRSVRLVAGAWAVVAPGGAPAAAVPIPTGGAVIDIEARQALSAAVQRLVQLGLIRS